MDRDIKKIVSQMTLEEKAGMCSGLDFWHLKSVERLGVPQVMVSDGPHGLRKQAQKADHLGLGESVVAVCFPAACAMASSFDKDLMYEMGRTLGDECQAEELSVLLGPAANIKRSPLCGRNFEYLSEDPYLAGKMAASYIKGVQSRGVGVSMKHYAVNNQEYNRMSCSSDLSERALREIYLKAFEIAVKESQPRTIMCSYNKINGVYASENAHLLNEILRDEWGFEGAVMTDWGAVADRVKGLEAGLDLEMPGSGGVNDKKIVDAVKDGSLDEKILDRAVERLLKVIFSYSDGKRPDTPFDRAADHEKAVDYETECAVLLKNDGILPLSGTEKVAYIGAYAESPRYQGGGSSHINASRVDSALESARGKNRQVTYAPGFPTGRDEANAAWLDEAVRAAQGADVAVIFAGLPDVIESEGYDRADMKLPACQNELIKAVLAVQPRTVVVLHNGSPVETPWADETAAVLEMYLGGEGVGEATDRLLYGECSPSGHLAESFPIKLEDNPSYLYFPGDGKHVNYAEGVFVGYRYYEKKGMPVRWAFGHGLSYTTFAYGNLQVSERLDDAGCARVTVDVTNTGNRAGKAVAQLYVSDMNGTPERPVKELKGFAKVELQPGETKTVAFELRAEDLSYFNEELNGWYAPSGRYAVMIGSASDDIAVCGTIDFTTKKLPPLTLDGSTTIGELLAHPVTAPVVHEMLSSMGGFFGGRKPDKEKKPEGGSMGTDDQMMQAMMKGMPLKSLASFGGPAAAERVGQLMTT
ncbi:MAG: glycoside hydrolase family 3 C-terminal domain-containing protein, partial [Clostridia bacterium]|nr:glycoside hydrolase family 3 C-terminal domain-containing protein [Clostridia bacterium]